MHRRHAAAGAPLGTHTVRLHVVARRFSLATWRSAWHFRGALPARCIFQYGPLSSLLLRLHHGQAMGAPWRLSLIAWRREKVRRDNCREGYGTMPLSESCPKLTMLDANDPLCGYVALPFE